MLNKFNPSSDKFLVRINYIKLLILYNDFIMIL